MHTLALGSGISFFPWSLACSNCSSETWMHKSLLSRAALKDFVKQITQHVIWSNWLIGCYVIARTCFDCCCCWLTIVSQNRLQYWLQLLNFGVNHTNMSHVLALWLQQHRTGFRRSINETHAEQSNKLPLWSNKQWIGHSLSS